jgi:hypothetical protein
MNLNKNIQNIIINYNKNKKLELLDELEYKTIHIKLYLSENINFNKFKMRIIRSFNLDYREYFWDVYPILLNI